MQKHLEEIRKKHVLVSAEATPDKRDISTGPDLAEQWSGLAQRGKPSTLGPFIDSPSCPGHGPITQHDWRKRWLANRKVIVQS